MFTVLLVREIYLKEQYLKLYLDQNQDQNQNQDHNQNQRSMSEHDRSSIIIVCKDEKDWIDPKTGVPYAGFEMGDINMITMKHIFKFKNSVIVLDDMGDKFDKDIIFYFTGRKKIFK